MGPASVKSTKIYKKISNISVIISVKNIVNFAKFIRWIIIYWRQVCIKSVFQSSLIYPGFIKMNQVRFRSHTVIWNNFLGSFRLAPFQSLPNLAAKPQINFSDQRRSRTYQLSWKVKHLVSWCENSRLNQNKFDNVNLKIKPQFCILNNPDSVLLKIICPKG